MRYQDGQGGRRVTSLGGATLSNWWYTCVCRPCKEFCAHPHNDFTLPQRGLGVRQEGDPAGVPVPLSPKLLAEHEPSVLIQTLNPLSTHPSCSRRRVPLQAKDKGTFVGLTRVPNLGQLFDQGESPPSLPSMARFKPCSGNLHSPAPCGHACMLRLIQSCPVLCDYGL